MRTRHLAPARRDWLFWGLGALLAFTLLEFPHHAYDLDHDLGSHASFEYYLSRGYQFGVDIYQNVGPLGCLHYTYSYAGYLHVLKVVGKTLLRLALAAQLLWLGAHLRPRWMRALAPLGVLVLLPVGDDSAVDFLDVNEAYAYLTVYLGGLFLIGPLGGWKRRTAAGGTILLLATMALTKHTSLVLAISAIGTATLTRTLRRDWRGAVVIPASFLACVLAVWVAARQHPVHVFAYVKGAFLFSAGYNHSMAFFEPRSWTVLGVAAALLMAAAIALSHTRGMLDLPRSLMGAFFLFVMWKHNYVRADVPHVTVLFFALPVFTLVFAFGDAVSAGGRLVARHGPRLAAVAAAYVLSFTAFWWIIPDFHYRPDRLTAHWRHNAGWLIDPVGRTADMERLLAESRRRYALPEIRRQVGGASVDMFGFQPGFVLLSDLNYTPRPMPITFVAASAPLLRANEAFYRDPSRAPAYVLSAYSAIENRLTTLDDGLAIGALLDNYRPVLVERDVLLLKRRETISRHAVRRELFEGTVALGEPVSVPDVPGSMVWAEVQMDQSLLGSVWSFLYKPPPAIILLQAEPAVDEVGVEPLRFITTMGPSGFPLSPMIYTNRELADLYGMPGQRPLRRRVRAFALACEPGDGAFFRPRVAVRLYSTPLPGAEPR